MKEDAAALAVVDGELSVNPPKLFIPADTTRYFGIQGRFKRVFDLLVASVAGFTGDAGDRPADQKDQPRAGPVCPGAIGSGWKAFQVLQISLHGTQQRRCHSPAIRRHVHRRRR